MVHIVLVILLVALAWGRLPYVMLCFVFLLKPLRNAQWHGKIFYCWHAAIAMIIVIAMVIFWARIVSAVHVELSPVASVQKQFGFLIDHIQLIPEIAINSLHGPNFWFALGGIFGSLGVLDSKLPLLFYPIALASLLIAVALETQQKDNLKLVDRIAVAAGLMLGIGAVFLALYVTDNQVGQLSIAGVQGRYLIPFIFGSAFVLPTATVHLRKPIRLLVLFLPLIALLNFAFSIGKIVTRFY